MELIKSKKKRKEYLRRAWHLFLLFVICIPVAGIIALFIPPTIYQGNCLGITIGYLILSFIPSLCIFGGYLLICYGRSGTQSMHLYEDMAVYSLYSGSLYNRELYTFYIKKIKRYILTQRNIKIYGEFEKQTADKFGYHDWITSRLTIPRTFEQEEKLLNFFDKIIV